MIGRGMCGVQGTPGIAASYWTLVAFWFVLRSLHLYLRYRCLHTLCFHTVNFKRAAILVRAHLNGDPLPGGVRAQARSGMGSGE